MDELNSADYRLLLSLLKFAIVAPDQRERVQGALEEAMADAERWEAPPPPRLGAPLSLNSVSFQEAGRLAMRAFMQENVFHAEMNKPIGVAVSETEVRLGLGETGHELT